MASTNKCTGFDPLDLAIVDSVYQAAWVQLVVRSPALNAEELEKRQQNLHQRVLAFATPGLVDFDFSLRKGHSELRSDEDHAAGEQVSLMGEFKPLRHRRI